MAETTLGVDREAKEAVQRTQLTYQAKVGHRVTVSDLLLGLVRLVDRWGFDPAMTSDGSKTDA